MKRTLILTGIIALSLTMPCFAADNTGIEYQKQAAQEFKKPDMPPPMNQEQAGKNKQDFEKRLNLSEEQKASAKELREQGRKEMEPVMKEIKVKRLELEVLKSDDSTTLGQLRKKEAELKELHKKAHDIRMKNMKEFEKLLTEKQLKELKKMKEEGKKKFEAAHKKGPNNFKNRPPMPPKKD